MFTNYFKIALRNLLRSKVYSFINIAGLAAGMAVALLIGLWIWDEFTWNHIHSRHHDLARAMNTRVENGVSNTESGVDVALAEELKTHYGRDFREVVIVGDFERHLLTVGEKKFQQLGLGCQQQLPAMLSLKMISGDIQALKDPSSILLTAAMTKALFGSQDAIGKTVRVDDKTELKVGGVYEDLPDNSDFHHAGYLLPWEVYLDLHPWVKNTQTKWGYNFIQIFVERAPGVEWASVNARIKNIPSQHVTAFKEDLQLQSMDSWHLYNEYTDGHQSGGRIRFVWLFGTIALFVLLLACINFMNLSTARSEKRALEVGIRKTMGSLRGQLIRQFLGESLLTAFFALILALVLTQLLLPLFNHLSAKQLTMPWSQPRFWSAALAFTIITGLLSGSYPAFYLSAFQPVKVLKGRFRAGQLAALPRKVLVVVQFTVSVVLIIATMIVYNQIQYAKARPLGYDAQGLVAVNLVNKPALKPHYNAIRTDLLATGLIEEVAGSSGTQTFNWMTRPGWSWPGMDPHMNPIFGHAAITLDYGRLAKWEIVQGRDYSNQMKTDTQALLVNEAAVRLAGFKDPIGQMMIVDSHAHPIIGVVKDMVIDSPYDPALPTVYFIDYSWINYISVRLKKGVGVTAGMASMKEVLKKYDADGLLSYFVIEDRNKTKFAGDLRIGSIATFFTILAVFISCLGLFGLASFVAEQRTREIGVRKVLGATVINLWSTLSKDFIKLVLIACVVAIPIAAYLQHMWLSQYKYRMTESWQLYVLAVVGALLLTLLTVSYQTLRAAIANPAKSLRTE